MGIYSAHPSSLRENKTKVISHPRCRCTFLRTPPNDHPRSPRDSAVISRQYTAIQGLEELSGRESLSIIFLGLQVLHATLMHLLHVCVWGETPCWCETETVLKYSQRLADDLSASEPRPVKKNSPSTVLVPAPVPVPVSVLLLLLVFCQKNQTLAPGASIGFRGIASDTKKFIKFYYPHIN